MACGELVAPFLLWIWTGLKSFSSGEFDRQNSLDVFDTFFLSLSLRRYWEDSESQQVFPKISTELDNKPGRGRIERLTHDAFRYAQLTVSTSNE